MKLNPEQRNIIYFPPKESDYFELKTKFLAQQLTTKYDVPLIKRKDSTICRFPSVFKSFKEEVDQGKSFIDTEKLKVLTSKNPEEHNSIERFEIFIYDLDNLNKISGTSPHDQSSVKYFNLVINSTVSHLSTSEISLTKENIDEIVNKVING